MFSFIKRDKQRTGSAHGVSMAGFCNFFGESVVVLSQNGNLYDEVIGAFGGKVLGNGAFKVFSREALPKWEGIAKSLFSVFRGELKLVGYDWMGRVHALDMRPGEDFETVVIIDTSARDLFHTDRTLIEYLNETIPELPDACVEQSMYYEWLDNHEPVPALQCAGFTVPLFLGGEYEVSNMEVSDMEVYWEMTHQLWEATKDLPEGTPIGSVSFD